MKEIVAYSLVFYKNAFVFGVKVLAMTECKILLQTKILFNGAFDRVIIPAKMWWKLRFIESSLAFGKLCGVCGDKGF